MAGLYLTSFDGAKIYYQKTTRNPNQWLVFLHGFGGDLTAWNSTRDYFNNLGLSTLALDLRGHGQSERRDGKSFYKFENFAKDLDLILKKEEIDNAVIIGHCFGGMVAIYFQAQVPNHSKGLILIDTSYKPPFFGTNFVAKAFLGKFINLILRFAPDIKRGGRRDFKKFIGTNDINFKRLLSDILHTSLRSYLLISSQLIHLNADELLDKISVPTLVVEGLNDNIFPPDVAKHLNKRIKNSKLDIIEGANHIIVLNNPKDLSKSIEEFLRKIKFI